MPRSDVDMRQDVEMTAKIEKFVFRFFFNCQVFSLERLLNANSSSVKSSDVATANCIKKVIFPMDADTIPVRIKGSLISPQNDPSLKHKDRIRFLRTDFQILKLKVFPFNDGEKW